MPKNSLGAILLIALLLSVPLALAFAQADAPSDSYIVSCTPIPVADKTAYVEGLLNSNGLSISNFSGGGLQTEVYSVRAENCGGGEAVSAYFRQSYGGIPILNYEAKAHFLKGQLQPLCQLVSSSELGKGACDGAKYLDFSQLPAQPAIAEDSARVTAMGAASGFDYAPNVSGMDSMLAYWHDYPNERFRLAWVFGQKMDLEFRPRQINAQFVVDATDGSVLFSDSGIRTGVATEIPAPSADSGKEAVQPLSAPAMYAGAEQKSAIDASKTQPQAQGFGDLAGIAAIALGAIVALVLVAGAIAIMLRPQDLTIHRALSNEVRAELLSELADTEKILTDLSIKVGRSKATTLEHLGKLVEAGLIERVETPGKKFVFYRITRHGKDALRSRTAA